MTDEYRKNLIEYLTGLLVEESEKTTDFSPEYTLSNVADYNGEAWEDFVIEMNGKNVVINGMLQSDKYDIFLLYGAYQDSAGTNSKGFIIYFDTTSNDVTPVKYYLTNTRGIQWLGFDEDTNRVYGITSDKANYQASSDYDTYFVYFNNLFLGLNDDFVPDQTYAYRIWNSATDDFMAREVIKDPGGSNYLIIGTNFASITKTKVLELKITVGQGNELNTWTINTNYLLYAIRGWYNNEDPHFQLIMLNTTSSPLQFSKVVDNGTSVSYTALSSDIALDTQQGNYVHPEYQVVNENEIYFIYNAIASSKREAGVYKYNGTSIETIYKTLNTPDDSLTPILNIMQDYDGTLYLRKYLMDYEDTPPTTPPINMIYTINMSRHINELTDNTKWRQAGGNLSYTTNDNNYNLRCFIKRNFNIAHFIGFAGYMRENFGDATEDICGASNDFSSEIVQNGYTGNTFTTRMSLVPSYGRLTRFGLLLLMFSRNFYNVSINNNVCTSSMEVPNNYINDIEVWNNVSVGKTAYPLIVKDQRWTKNIYEVVHINFMNTINIIDEDTSIYYLPGAVKLNYNTNDIGVTNYNDTKCTKYRVNYNDNTTLVGNIVWTNIDDYHKNTNFTISASKEIDSIDLISNDESTIYLTIKGEFEVGKDYLIKQKVRINENS